MPPCIQSKLECFHRWSVHNEAPPWSLKGIHLLTECFTKKKRRRFVYQTQITKTKGFVCDVTSSAIFQMIKKASNVVFGWELSTIPKLRRQKDLLVTSQLLPSFELKQERIRQSNDKKNLQYSVWINVFFYLASMKLLLGEHIQAMCVQPKILWFKGCLGGIRKCLITITRKSVAQRFLNQRLTT